MDALTQVHTSFSKIFVKKKLSSLGNLKVKVLKCGICIQKYECIYKALYQEDPKNVCLVELLFFLG